MRLGAKWDMAVPSSRWGRSDNTGSTAAGRDCDLLMLGTYPEAGVRVGGPAAATESLAAGIARFTPLKIEVASAGSSTSGTSSVIRNGHPVHYLAANPRLPYTLAVFTTFRRAYRHAIRCIRPRCIHAQGIDAGALAAASAGIPWLMTVHGIHSLELQVENRGLWSPLRYFLMLRLQNRCLRVAPLILAPSPLAQRVCGQQLAEKFRIVPNAVDERFFSQTTEDRAISILYAGALRPLKGIEYLLDAFSNVHRRLPVATLRIAGWTLDASYSERLWQRVRELGIDSVVTFLGHLDAAALAHEMARSQALCIPSLHENAPLVVQEAMATGTPVIATTVGGIDWQLTDGRHGFLVPPADAPALTSAMERLLTNRDLAARFGEAARVSARNRFHPRVVAEATQELYREAIATGTRDGLSL